MLSINNLLSGAVLAVALLAFGAPCVAGTTTTATKTTPKTTTTTKTPFKTGMSELKKEGLTVNEAKTDLKKAMEHKGKDIKTQNGGTVEFVKSGVKGKPGTYEVTDPSLKK